MSDAKTTWIASGMRTPFTKMDGGLGKLGAIELSIPVAQAMVSLADDGPDLMVWGAVAPNLTYSNLAREVALDAGMDPHIPAYSTVMACSTSMAGALQAAGMVGAGGRHLALVGGVESMSRVQIGLNQQTSDWLRRVSQARSAEDRIKRVGEIPLTSLGLYTPKVANRTTGKSMGEHCEEMAKEWGISREDQDQIALDSHMRSVAAWERGFYDSLVLAIEGVRRDAFPRPGTSLEKLAALKPAFDRTSGRGTLTAGNSSPLTDGAAAVWVADHEGAERLPQDTPRVKLVDYEIAAVDL
ncbi:MAG: acetyl-CoA C-acyltransferase, partial [Myxococcota bacterium]